MNRFYASALVALLAAMAAHDAGVPLWGAREPGDVCDFAIVSFWATWFLIRALGTTVIVNVGKEASNASV